MTASELFCDDFLQDVLVERQIRYEPLESRILGLELPKLAQLRDTQARVLILPDVKGRLGNSSPRQTSETGVPASAWRKTYAICSCVNLDFFIASLFSPWGL